MIRVTRDDVNETLCPGHMSVHKYGQIYEAQFIGQYVYGKIKKKNLKFCQVPVIYLSSASFKLLAQNTF